MLMVTDLAIANEKIQDISLESKIGEGKFREVYQYENRAIKILKPYIRKDYGLFHINIPIHLYTKFKFGIADFNEFEYNNYRKIIDQVPSDIKDSFAEVFEVRQHQGDSLSINELVVNVDGSVSKALKQYGMVRNSGFWERLGKLEEFFLNKGISYLDIKPGNILVKELEDENIIPVIVDYKGVGTRTYPIQFNLLIKSQISKKIKRRFSRIRNNYQSNS